MIKVYKIIELIGDGISKEITQQATKILRVIEKENKHHIDLVELQFDFFYINQLRLS